LWNELVVVGNAGTGEIALFNADDGTFVRALGGAGQGPGEFRQMGRVHIDADQVVVNDAATGLIKRFSLRDGAVSAHRYQGGEPLLSVQPFGTGRYVALTGLEGSRMRNLRPNAGPARPPVPLLILDSLGNVSDTLAQVPNRSYALTSTASSGFSMFEPPFAPRTYIEVVGDCVLVATGNETIDVYAVGTGKQFVIRVDSINTTLTQDEWEHRLSAIEAGQDDLEVRAALREIHGTLEAPDIRPAVSGMLYDRRGRLWIETYHHFDEDAPGWWVLDIASGDWTWLEAPQNVRRLLAVGHERLVLLHVDELGTETITLVPLRRANQ
jgi:hypothetical protein